jgi:putative inorganic carbon (hco3(-)) transporter
MKADGHGLEKGQHSGLDSPASSRRLMAHVNGVLILSPLALMPLDEAGYNAAMAALGVLGLVALIRTPGVAHDCRFRLVAALLACLWVPMVISLPFAMEAERAVRTTAAFLRFPFAAAYIILAIQHPITRHWLSVGLLAVAGIWSIDGLIQWQAGRNIFGFPYDGINLTGIFHPKRVIGLLLAPLMPVLLEAAWQLARRKVAAGAAAWLVVATMPVVILLAGSRTSWMLLVVGVSCWLMYRYWRSTWRYKTLALVATIVALALALPFLARLPGLETRLEQTSRLFSGDYEAINAATSGRLPIWEISLAMWRDHWLTGVGPRGFRYRYPDYADDDTPWVSPDGATGASHPHQTVLEVLVETGIIGLGGFILFWVILATAAWRCGNERSWPWAIAVLLAFFPLSTHMAIYGTYWSHFSWWILMIMAGMLTSHHASVPSDPQQLPSERAMPKVR